MKNLKVSIKFIGAVCLATTPATGNLSVSNAVAPR